MNIENRAEPPGSFSIENPELFEKREKDSAELLANSAASLEWFGHIENLNLDYKFQKVPLPEPLSPNSKENLRLISLFDGHRGLTLHELIKYNDAPVLSYLSRLLSWLAKYQRTGQLDVGTLESEAPEVLRGKNFEQLQEICVACSRDPNIETDSQLNDTILKGLRKVFKDERLTRWKKDTFNKVFSRKVAKQTVRSLLTEIGFIPSSYKDHPQYKQLDVLSVTKLISYLQEISKDQGEDTAIVRLALNERAKLINNLLTPENLRRLDSQPDRHLEVALDTNGLLIKAKGMDTHLPYGLLEQNNLNSLASFRSESKSDRPYLLSISEAEEMKLRAAEQRGDIEEYTKLRKSQFLTYCNNIFHIKPKDFEECVEYIRDGIGFYLDRTASTQAITTIIPDVMLQLVIEAGALGSAIALTAAEWMSSELTKATIPRFSPWERLSYEILNRTKQIQRARETFMNRREYYSAAKTGRFVLAGDQLEYGQEKSLMYIGRTPFNQPGEEHYFVGVVRKDRFARILIDRKHLAGSLDAKRGFDNLPLYEEEEYLNLENQLAVYKHFYTSTILVNANIVKYWNSARFLDFDQEHLHKLKNRFLEYTQSALYFTLAYGGDEAKDLYKEAVETYEELKSNPYRWSREKKQMERLIEIFETVRKSFEKSFFRDHSELTNKIEIEQPKVRLVNQSFDAIYMQEAEKICTKERIGIDTTNADHKERVAYIDPPSGSDVNRIPFVEQEAALDAIHLDRDPERPSIFVLGGSSLFSDESGGAMVSQTAKELIELGHSAGKKPANILVNGTQAGLGIYFGKGYIDYQRNYSHLPEKKRLRLYSIVPAGGVYLKDNKYLENHPSGEVWAATPVSLVATPNSAEWELRDQSPYIDFVERSAAIYERASAGQARMIDLINGGYFAVHYLLALSRNDIPIIIHNKTGRLADALANILETLDDLPKSYGDEAQTWMYKKLKDKMPVASQREFFKKDFGPGGITNLDTYSSFREVFYKLLVRLKRLRHETATFNTPEGEKTFDQVMVVEPEDVREKIEELIRKFPKEWRGV